MAAIGGGYMKRAGGLGSIALRFFGGWIVGGDVDAATSLLTKGKLPSPAEFICQSAVGAVSGTSDPLKGAVNKVVETAEQAAGWTCSQ